MATISKTQFQSIYTYNWRQNQAKSIRSKYRDKIPVIVHPLEMVKPNPSLDKVKYLCNFDMTLSQFLFVIKKRLLLKPCDALFLFVNGKIPVMTKTMIELYDSDSDSDGFLYIEYSIENTFG